MKIINVLVSLTLVLLTFTVHAQDKYAFKEYKANYILYGYGGDNDDLEPNSACDIKFQVSFVKPLKTGLSYWVGKNLGEKAVKAFGNFNMAYSQKSFWDICRESYPFRETNYNPSFFWDNAFSVRGAHNLTFKNNYGYEHESNGRDGEISRSWDRIFYQQKIFFGNENPAQYFVTEARPHYAYEASFKLWGVVNKGIENDDIENFQGNAELSLAKTTDNHRFELTARQKSARLNWYIYNLLGPSEESSNFYWMLQAFSGYGESLQSYNRKENVLRAGFAFTY